MEIGREEGVAEVTHMVVPKVTSEGWVTRLKVDSASRAGMVPQVLNFSVNSSIRGLCFHPREFFWNVMSLKEDKGVVLVV